MYTHTCIYIYIYTYVHMVFPTFYHSVLPFLLKQDRNTHRWGHEDPTAVWRTAARAGGALQVHHHWSVGWWDGMILIRLWLDYDYEIIIFFFSIGRMIMIHYNPTFKLWSFGTMLWAWWTFRTQSMVIILNEITIQDTYFVG